jgi:hypothetical protein
MSVYNESIQGSRARMYIGIILQENDPALNRSRVRVYAGISDASTTLGGTGTASYSVTVSNVGELAFSTQPYNFTGNSGRDYRFFDNSSIWVPHTANGSQTVTAYLSVSFFNSFIPGNNISVSMGLTDYDISTGNIWNGTAFVKGVVYMWNGTAFVKVVPKLWNGSNFIGV